MKRNHYLLVLLALIISISANAQFSLTGEIRPRTEMYGGNNSRLRNEGEAMGVATQQRSRLYFTYQDTTGLKIVFSPQMVHFWGQMPQAYDLLGDGIPGSPEGSFSIFEAYAEYKASDWYTLKAGRQAISYKDQRWFGALGWAASGRSHDAFVNKLTLGKVKLDVGAALNRTMHFQGVDVRGFAGIRGGYNSMYYAWATVPAGKLKIDAMINGVNTLTNLAELTAGTTTDTEFANVTTFGILPTYKSGDLTINASAYLQSSENRSASLFAIDITTKVLGFPLTVGADIVSGDDLSTEDESEAWLQPFGTNHKFYGLMDFFYVGSGEAVGLNDFYAKAVFKTGSKSKLIVMPHFLSTNQDILNLDDELEGGSYGTEIDLVYNLNVSKGFNFKFGYSTIFATELLEAYKGGSADEFNHWAWMQLTFKPKFL